MSDKPDKTEADRLRRIRDMLLGREPSLLTQIVATQADIVARLSRIETDLNETKATSLGGTATEIPKP